MSELLFALIVGAVGYVLGIGVGIKAERDWQNRIYKVKEESPNDKQ